MKSRLPINELILTVSLAVLLASPAQTWAQRGGGGGSAPLTNPAFVFRDGVDGGLFLLSYDGATRQRLTSPSGSGSGIKDYLPTWSPDLDPSVAGYQGKIAFFRQFDSRYIWGEIKVVAANGGSSPVTLRAFTDFTIPPPEVANQNESMSWSPNGSHLIYASEGAIWALQVGTGNVVRLLADDSNPIYAGFKQPCFSGDLDTTTPGYQGQVVFTANGNAPPGGGNGSDIGVANVDIDVTGAIHSDGNWLLLTNTTEVAESQPVWSPDATYIAWFTNPAVEESLGSGRRLGVFVPAIDASWDVAAVVKYGVRPSWSPDGIEIGYSADRAVGTKTTFDVFRVSSTGSSAPVLVTRTDSNRALEDNAIWSPVWQRPN